MYFLILRPQKRKDKDRKSLLSRIKKNDKVVTSVESMGLSSLSGRMKLFSAWMMPRDVKVKVDRTSIVAVVEVSHDDTEESKEPKEIAKENKDAK